MSSAGTPAGCARVMAKEPHVSPVDAIARSLDGAQFAKGMRMIFGILAGLVVVAAIAAGVVLARRRQEPSAPRNLQRSVPAAVTGRATGVEGGSRSRQQRAVAAPGQARSEASERQPAVAEHARSAPMVPPVQPPSNAIAGAPVKPVMATTPAQPPTVLIVDDSPIVRRTLETTFSKAGYRIASAESGEAAVQWVRSNGMPPLVTLDMEMPGMNGLDTLRALHDLPAQRPVRAVFITSKNHERVRDIAEPLGAVAFFSKPYSNVDLLAVAQRVAPLPAAV